MQFQRRFGWKEIINLKQDFLFSNSLQFHLIVKKMLKTRVKKVLLLDKNLTSYSQKESKCCFWYFIRWFEKFKKIITKPKFDCFFKQDVKLSSKHQTFHQCFQFFLLLCETEAYLNLKIGFKINYRFTPNYALSHGLNDVIRNFSAE